MPELTPEERREIIKRRGYRSDKDGEVDRSSNLEIHHKDRNHLNNNPRNLGVLTKGEHHDLHRRAGY